MADAGNMIAPQGFGDNSQKPQMIKSVFNDAGDLVKDLTKSGLLKGIKDINVTLGSIKGFLIAQKEYFKIFKEKITEKNAIPPKNAVSSNALMTTANITKPKIDTSEFRQESMNKDIKGYFSDWKYHKHKDNTWQKAILGRVEELSDRGIIKLLFLLVTVGVVTLITKVSVFLHTLSVFLRGFRMLLTVGGKIPLIGRFIKPFENLFNVFYNGLRRIINIFDELPNKIVNNLSSPIKLISKILKFAEKVGNVLGKFSFGSAILKFTKPFSEIVNVITGGAKFVTGSVGRLKGITRFARPFLKVLGIGSKFLKLIPVVGQILTVIMGFVDAIVGWFNADAIVGHVASFGDKVLASISSVVSGLLLGLVSAKTLAKIFEPFARIIDNIKQVWVNFFNIFDNVSSFSDFVNNIKVFINKYISLFFDNIKQAFKLLFLNIPKFINELLINSLRYIGNLFSKIGSWFSKDSLIGKVFNSIGSFFQSMGDSWDETIKMYESILSDFDNIKEIFKMFVDWFGEIGDSFGRVFSKIGDVFSNLWVGIQNKVSNLGSKLKGAFSSIFDSIVSGLKNLPTSIKNAIGGLASTFASVFSNIPTMIVDSIKSALSVIGSAKGLFDGAADLLGFGDKNKESVKSNETPQSHSQTPGDKNKESVKSNETPQSHSQTPVNVPVSDKQTDNGENLQKVIEKKSTKTEEQSELTSLNAQQLDFMKSMVEINKQMLSRMTPTTNVAFN